MRRLPKRPTMRLQKKTWRSSPQRWRINGQPLRPATLKGQLRRASGKWPAALRQSTTLCGPAQITPDQMKLQATISQSPVDVEIRQQGPRLFATVSGLTYELELTRASEREFLLVSDGRVFDCRVDGRIEPGATVDVTICANRYAVTLVDPKRLRSALDSGAHGEGAARIVAPMPGKVVRLLVEAGQEVETGHGIVVVEAMKMQNEMKSPKSGTIVSINVAVGATVNGGDLLAVVE
jgi:biotin carboxyl carrier protein